MTASAPPGFFDVAAVASVAGLRFVSAESVETNKSMSASSDVRTRDKFGGRKVKKATFVLLTVFVFSNTKKRHCVFKPFVLGFVQDDGLAPIRSVNAAMPFVSTPTGGVLSELRTAGL